MKTSRILTITMTCSMFAVQASGVPLVGYGSSNAVLPAKNQELFLMGFEVGLQKATGKKSLSEILVLDQVADGTQLGAIGATERLLAKDVSIVAGFPTSHEALLAAKTAKDKGVLTLFAAAGHSDLANMGPSVFTTGESMNYSVDSTLQFVMEHFKGKRGLLISNPYAVFSKNQEDAFLEHLKSAKYKDLSITATHLDKELQLPAQDLKSLTSSNYDYVMLTAYADESAKLLGQLEKAKVDLPLVTNSSWNTGDVDFGRRFLTTRKSPTYVATLWVKGSPDSKPFEQLIEKRYGRPATSELAYGYDLGLIVGKVLSSVKGPVTKKSVLETFLKLKCFEGLTAGRMCFSPEGGHARRKIVFMQFTTKGFKPLSAKE